MAVGIFVAALPARADEQQRIALVIGNSEYRAVPHLQNPRNDARDIGAALERIGFEVTAGFDLDFRAMRLAIRDFSEAAETADVVLIYFAGHGIEVDNTNYLIPVNAELKRDRDVEFEAIRLDALLSAIEPADGLKIVLVDACRNNPFSSQMSRQVASRSIGRGLGRIEPSGVLVGYAAKGGTVALDGSGRNSPYAAALLKHLEEPGLELGKLFRKVRDTVYAATAGAQEPFIYGSLPGRDIYLVPPLPEPEPVVATPEPAAPAVAPSEEINARIIAAFTEANNWNTLRQWGYFLKEFKNYPDNALVALGQRRHDELALEMDIERGFRVGQKGLSEIVSPRGVERGFDNRDLKLIQTALNMMGFDPGGADGQLGPRTRNAIAEARDDVKLPKGSHIDQTLLRVLPNVAAVRTLQSDKARKYGPEDIREDLEPRLRKALLAYQGRELLFDYFQGHLYLAIRTSGYDLNWTAMNKAAEKAGGHLVTLGSAAENDFVVSLFSKDQRFIINEWEGYRVGPMIGLYQPDRTREPAGGWKWVTGEPTTFRSWSRGNPDNYQNRQHYARYWRHKRYKGTNVPVKFWDDGSQNYGPGYIIEIE